MSADIVLKVDKEFQSCVPEHRPDERAELRKLIMEAGRRLDTIKIWNGIIVDGMTSYDICRNEGLPFKIQEMEFKDRAEAIRWIKRNQLGRRNLTDDQRALLAAELVEMKPGDATCQNGKSRKNTAKEAQVTVRKVDRARAVVSHGSEKLVDAVRDGHVGVSDAETVTDLPPAKQDAAVKAVESGKADTVTEAAYDMALKAIESVNGKAAADLKAGRWKLSKKRVIELGGLSKDQLAKELRDERMGITSAEPKASEIKDTAGVLVPTKLAYIFETRQLFEHARQCIARIQEDALRIMDGLYGTRDERSKKPFSAQSVKAMAAQLFKMFDDNEPRYVCRGCGGEAKGCSKCRDRGFQCR